MNVEKFNEFSKAYRAALQDCAEMGFYGWPATDAPKVADKMLQAIEKNPNSVTYTNSPGFKKACAFLQIKYTVKSIKAYLEV